MTVSLAARAQQPDVAEAERCLGIATRSHNPIEVRRYADTAYTIAQQLGDRRLMAKALNNLAWSYCTCDIYDTAIILYKQQLLIALNINDKPQAAKTYCNLGQCYKGTNKYFEMWDNFRQAADLYQQLDDTANLSWAISSMGSSYEEIGLYNKAKELYYKALHLAESTGDTIETGATLHKIADCTSLQFFERNDPKATDTLLAAKKQFIKAALLLKGVTDESGTFAQNLLGLARCYIKLAGHLHRIDYADSCDRCIDLYQDKFADQDTPKRQLQAEMLNIQSLVFRRNYTAALPAIQKILPNFPETDHPVQLGECYRLMSICYNALGDYKRAYECSERHTELFKKSHDDETMKRISNFAAQTELYKAREEHDVFSKRQQQLMETEQSRQRFFYALMSLAIGAVVVMTALISVMLYSRQRSNKLLKSGNETRAALSQEYIKQLQAVADAQNIIVSSVEYASIIQSETIGSAAKVKELFPESFVYYKPRDIVSGDWYYSSKVNGNKMLVSADCTGHGIPGAMLSMLGVGALKDIINDLEATNAPVLPGDILDKMRASVKLTLNMNDKNPATILDDGMDMTIIVLPPDSDELLFGSANQSALIVHDGVTTRLKGDPNSIGNNIREKEHFTTITTKISRGDSVYLFSDGVYDQIGGPTMTKFSIRQLADFVAELSKLPIENQLQKFTDDMDEWTGKMVQLDDRLFIGMRREE